MLTKHQSNLIKLSKKKCKKLIKTPKENSKTEVHTTHLHVVFTKKKNQTPASKKLGPGWKHERAPVFWIASAVKKKQTTCLASLVFEQFLVRFVMFCGGVPVVFQGFEHFRGASIVQNGCACVYFRKQNKLLMFWSLFIL